VTSQQRDEAKQCCYAVVYGSGPEPLARALGIPLPDALQKLRNFKSRYRGVGQFARRLVKECRSVEGFYVETLMGRRRSMRHGCNCLDAAELQRKAVNTVCQGSAADLIKLAMVNIHQRLRDEEEEARNNNNTTTTNSNREAVAGGAVAAAACLSLEDRCRLVNCVHDELIYEVRHDAVDHVAKIVQDCMTGVVPGLRVPLVVRLKVGPNWAEMCDFIK